MGTGRDRAHASRASPAPHGRSNSFPRTSPPASISCARWAWASGRLAWMRSLSLPAASRSITARRPTQRSSTRSSQVWMLNWRDLVVGERRRGFEPDAVGQDKGRLHGCRHVFGIVAAALRPLARRDVDALADLPGRDVRPEMVARKRRLRRRFRSWTSRRRPLTTDARPCSLRPAPMTAATTVPMTLDRDAEIPMRDGAPLRANVYRPDGPGRFPVLMTFGPYGKDVPLREFMQEAWDRLNETYPEILAASSCRHLVFERPDPEVWVPHGYVVIAVDSRGAGRSPGRLDPNSPAEFRDFYDAIEWAAAQPWSSGKVGLLGISYYAAGQWFVAAMRPPHL